MAKRRGWEWVMWSLRRRKKQSHQLSKESRGKKNNKCSLDFNNSESVIMKEDY